LDGFIELGQLPLKATDGATDVGAKERRHDLQAILFHGEHADDLLAPHG